MRDVVVQKLNELAAKVELIEPGPNAKFKKAAFIRAAKAIALLPALNDLSQLDGVKGVGEGIRKKVAEILATGSLARLDNAVDFSDLLRIPGMGPVSAHRLHAAHGVTTVQQVIDLARSGEITDETLIRHARLALARNGGRLPREQMLELAGPIEFALRAECPRAIIEAAGSLRRKRPTCQDVDFIFAAGEEDVTRGREVFLGLGWDEVSMEGPTRISAVRHGIAVDIRFVPKECYGSVILYFTGSRAFNVFMRQRAKRMGFKLNEYGLWKVGVEGETLVAREREEHIFDALEMRRFSPEEREEENLGAEYVPPKPEDDPMEVYGVAELDEPRMYA
jgi:DNA polymerase (family 10)